MLVSTKKVKLQYNDVAAAWLLSENYDPSLKAMIKKYKLVL
jgi:hypothetical protein